MECQAIFYFFLQKSINNEHTLPVHAKKRIHLAEWHDKKAGNSPAFCFPAIQFSADPFLLKIQAALQAKGSRQIQYRCLNGLHNARMHADT